MSNIETPAELTREHVRLLVSLRRMLREEFEITVHLHEDGAEARLLDMAVQSRRPEALELAGRLAALGDPREEGSKPAKAVNRYRGAIVQQETARTLPESSGSTGAGRARSVRIYRGRVVED